MSVIAGLAKATAGAKLLTGTMPTTGFLPKTKWTLMVLGVILLALVTFAVLIPASHVPSTDHSSTASMNSQLRAAAPVSYQQIVGERVPVESRYVLEGDGGYGFAVGAYDPRYPLIIDPGLAYSTFLGGRVMMWARILPWTEVAGLTLRGSPAPPTILPPAAPSTERSTETLTPS